VSSYIPTNIEILSSTSIAFRLRRQLPPGSTLFPYTTLFRSRGRLRPRHHGARPARGPHRPGGGGPGPRPRLCRIGHGRPGQRPRADPTLRPTGSEQRRAPGARGPGPSRSGIGARRPGGVSEPSPPVRSASGLSAPGRTIEAMRPVSDLVRAEHPFEVVSPFTPSGDQPTAVADLTRRINDGEQDVVLLGATGTGKSATTAWLIEQLQRPTLVMGPNKTLAAQLASEVRELLPHNAVEYFGSYYDYYQPEAYVPQSDTYIEKDSSINAEVERLRHSATNSLLTRR